MTRWALLLAVLAVEAFAYEIETHRALSGAAADASLIASPSGPMSELGLKAIDDGSQQFPNSNGEPQIARELIRDGARFEDNNIRPRNHFFDPINNRPLTVGGVAIGATSPDWALEDNGQITGFLTFGSQDFSFADARRYFYNALTSKSVSDQKTSFGRTFQTLGQVIHHIQDMAQPQHVRNDPHMDTFSLGGLNPAYAPSRYERYTDGQIPNLPFGGSEFYDGSLPLGIVRPRDFWATQTQPGPDRGTGAGLAEFTNNNFVSAGTNFLLLNDTAVPGRYFLPLPDNFTSQLIESFGSDEPVPPNVRAECAKRAAGCSMTFYSSTVWDKRLNRTYTNPRASTLSVFDQDLRAISGQVTYTNPDTGETFTTDRLFALNNFNFAFANKFLIPRAVAYSAGMINYFFRGKIDLVPDPGNPAQFLIQNLGSEPMNGMFELYYDALDGNRYQVLDASNQPLKFSTNGDLAPGQNLPVAAFAPPTDPEPKKPLAYMLVFRGDIGEEKATAQTVGAVAAKLVTARPGLGLYLLGVDASGNAVTMKVDSRGLRVIRGLDATGAFIQNDQEFDPFQGGVPRNNPTGVVAQAHQLKQVVFQPSVTGDTSYKVLSVAVGEAKPPIVNGFESLPVTARSYVLDSTQSGLVSQGSGASWLANSPLGTFTFNLTPNISFDGFTRIFFAAGGALQYTLKLADGSISTGSVPLPPLANLIGNYAYTHGDYDGFRHGTLFVSGDGLTLSGLKPLSPVDNDPTSLNINYSALQISPTNPPTVSLVSNGSTKVTNTPEVVIRNIVTRVGTLCANIDSSVMTTVVNASERFYIGYVNNGLSEYTRIITDSGGFSEQLETCTVSSSSYTETNIRSASGRKGQFDYSFGLSYADTNQSETIGGSRTTTTLPTGTSTGTPGQTTITVSETNVVRILTNEAKNAVTTLQTASSFTVPPARLRFRGTDLGLSEFVADSSPLGEVFFATSDMGMVVHEPKSRMPAITRGDIPANVVKLLAAIWL
jgi:hypothetical protein